MSRFDYVKYDETAVQLQTMFKIEFEKLDQLVDALADSRSKALVLTKLEEAYMWIGKAIRDNQLDRNGSAPLQEQRKNGQLNGVLV